MRSLGEFKEIYLCRTPVDGRKFINGLSAIVESQMHAAPFGGGLFVFTNRRRTTVKLLYWDRSGFALWMKRLEEEKFRWPVKLDGDVITLSSEQLRWLLDGYDITRMKAHQTLSYLSVS